MDAETPTRRSIRHWALWPLALLALLGLIGPATARALASGSRSAARAGDPERHLARRPALRYAASSKPLSRLTALRPSSSMA
jgi:hypothetical protein